MSNVFISYSRLNKEIVTLLAADIAALGNETWLDEKLSGGQAWWDQILERVRNTDIFVFALAPGALDSVACKREYEYAVELGKSILPVLVADGVSTNLLPPALATTQFVDYRAQDRAAALQLAKAIGSLPASRPLPEPLPSPPEAPISYLGGLAERVSSPDTLGFAEQSALLLDIKASLGDPETARDGLELLRRLKKRRDLLATIANEIDPLLADKGPGARAGPGAGAGAAAPVVSREPAAASAGQPWTTRNTKLWGWGKLLLLLVAYVALGVTFFVFVDDLSVYTSDSSSYRRTVYEDVAMIGASLTTVAGFVITLIANWISRSRRWIGTAIALVGFAAIGLGVLIWLNEERVKYDGELAGAAMVWGLGIVVTAIIAFRAFRRTLRGPNEPDRTRAA